MTKIRAKKKTVKEWQEEFKKDFVIEEPTGWPNGTMDSKEKLEKTEFLHRALKSKLNRK
jgi:hypothetical protein